MKSNSAIIDEKYLLPLGNATKEIIDAVSVVSGGLMSIAGFANGDPGAIMAGPMLAFIGSVYVSKMARHFIMNFARDGLKDLMESNVENKSLSSLIDEGAKTNYEMYKKDDRLEAKRSGEETGAAAGALTTTAAFTTLFLATGAVTSSVVVAVAAGLGVNHFLKRLSLRQSEREDGLASIEQNQSISMEVNEPPKIKKPGV